MRAPTMAPLCATPSDHVNSVGAVGAGEGASSDGGGAFLERAESPEPRIARRMSLSVVRYVSMTASAEGIADSAFTRSATDFHGIIAAMRPSSTYSGVPGGCGT